MNKSWHQVACGLAQPAECRTF